MRTKKTIVNPSRKILSTAIACLSEKGYANVSMRDIASESGVALSQLTYYFKNKEGLFTEVIHEMMAQYLQEMEDTMKSAVGAKAKTASLISYFKDLVKEKPKLLRLFIDFTAQSLWVPSFREQVDHLFCRLTEMIEENILKDTEMSANLDGYSSASIARYILGALYGTSIQIMLGSDKTSAFESFQLTDSLFAAQEL